MLAEYEPTTPVDTEEGRRIATEREIEAYEPEVPVTEGPLPSREGRREQLAREEIAKVEKELREEETILPDAERRKADEEFNNAWLNASCPWLLAA